MRLNINEKWSNLIFFFQLVTEEGKKERERADDKLLPQAARKHQRTPPLTQRGQLTNNLFWKRKLIFNLIPCLAKGAFSSIIIWPSHIDTQINQYYLIVLYLLTMPDG